MPFPVVTIARTLGANGEEVGRAVADQLGYAYADDEIISTAAERAGVSRESVAKAERKPSLIARIIDVMASAPLEPHMYYGQAISAAGPMPASEGYDEIIRDVIVGTAARGKTVIVAHGAGICLRDTPGVLRALITASPARRAERLAAATGASAEDAKKAVARSDDERASFLRRFYDVRHEEATHYDLILNTDVLSSAAAAALLAAAARD